MRATITTAILALASSVFAQTPGFDAITKPNEGELVPAGATYQIEWEPSTNWTGTVTIDLLGGPNQQGLQPLSTIAEGVDSDAGEYSWAVDKTIGNLNAYGLRITLDSDPTVFQYSFPFAIQAVANGNSSTSGSSGNGTATSTGTSGGGSNTTATTVTNPTVTPAPTGGNLSTTGTPSKTFVTTTTTGSSNNNPTGTTVPTNPGAIVRASSIALFGGLALAFFAL